MKKVLIAVLTLTMLLTAAVGAMAETFTLSVPCQAIADSQLYNHHATAFAYKRNSINTIYVSHHVSACLTPLFNINITRLQVVATQIMLLNMV